MDKAVMNMGRNMSNLINNPTGIQVYFLFPTL